MEDNNEILGCYLRKWENIVGILVINVDYRLYNDLFLTKSFSIFIYDYIRMPKIRRPKSKIWLTLYLSYHFLCESEWWNGHMLWHHQWWLKKERAGGLQGTLVALMVWSSELICLKALNWDMALR